MALKHARLLYVYLEVESHFLIRPSCSTFPFPRHRISWQKSEEKRAQEKRVYRYLHAHYSCEIVVINFTTTGARFKLLSFDIYTPLRGTQETESIKIQNGIIEKRCCESAAYIV